MDLRGAGVVNVVVAVACLEFGEADSGCRTRTRRCQFGGEKRLRVELLALRGR